MSRATVLKGRVLSFNGDPSVDGAQAISFWDRGTVIIQGGLISAVGDLSGRCEELVRGHGVRRT